MTALKGMFSLILLTTVSGVVSIKNVSISKCCNEDEFLISNNSCIKNDSTFWDISIYGKGQIRPYKGKLPLNWVVKENSRPKCTQPVIVDLSAKSYVPMLNGSLLRMETFQLIHPSQFCLDYMNAVVCLPPQQLTHVLVKKCCGQNAVYIDKDATCKRLVDPAYEIRVNFSLGIGFPTCKENVKEYALAGYLHETKMFSNGSLWLENAKVLLGTDEYCLETVLEHTGRSPTVMICRSRWPPPPTQVRVGPADKPADLRFTLFPIGLALSAVFLAATLAAGALLPASHHVVHWRCQTNYVACLLVGDVLLCITQLSNKIEFVPCFCIALAMLFLFLSAFFWLNTMCFNIWWTFRDLRPQSSEKSQERLRLRLYEAYAWGIPFLITFIAAILDLVPRSSDVDFLGPRFATNKCWFYGDAEIFTFFYGPVAILLIINLILFALTARELTCGLWKRELVKSTTERAALGRVCMKLVVVMGITWIADVISWVVGGRHEIWYVTDLINSLQGVFIFVVVGLQPQVLQAVKRAWGMRKHRQNGTAATSNHHSSSSQGLPSMGDTITNTNSLTNGTKSIPLETSC